MAQDGNRVGLEGEWDLSRAEEIKQLLRQLSVEREATIDLRACDYLDSSVLGALVALRERFDGQPVTLLGPSANIRLILKIANFEKLFRIVDAD